MLESARRDHVLRDGFASFFHHWFLGIGPLKQLVEPMQARGWTFVDPRGVAAEAACR